MTIRSIAQEAADHFEIASRDDGSRYVKTRDERPDWLHDLIQDAHDGMLPDDWRYLMICDALDALAGLDDDAGEGQAEQAIEEIGAPVYTRDLLAWLGSHNDRMSYADEALREGVARDIAGAMTVGYLTEQSIVGARVLAFILAHA